MFRGTSTHLHFSLQVTQDILLHTQYHFTARFYDTFKVHLIILSSPIRVFLVASLSI